MSDRPKRDDGSVETGLPEVGEPFEIISANGMQSQITKVGTGPSGINPRPRTHDTSRAVYHLENIDEFAEKLEEAAKSVFPNRNQCSSRYKNVQVVLMRWEDDDNFGVSCELEDLDKVFRDDYGFETTTWLIPKELSLASIMAKAVALVSNAELESKLLIVYYGGHAAMTDDRQQMWYRTGRQSEGLLKWSAVQELFLEVKADVLFLLDCCAAASAATTSPNVVGTKETIAACGFEHRAPEPGAHSFTSELIEVLHKWRHRIFSVGMLHSELLVNLRHPKPRKDMFGKIVESRRTPVYFITTPNCQVLSITLARGPDKDPHLTPSARPRKRQRTSPEPDTPENYVLGGNKSEVLAATPTTSMSSEESSLSHIAALDPGKYASSELHRVLPEGDFELPHVLISLALEGEQLLDVKAWERWLADCPSFAKYAKIEGKYKSRSTLLILSLPVVIWNMLPENLAYSFIGYVESPNHAGEQLRQDQADSQSWSDISDDGSEWTREEFSPEQKTPSSQPHTPGSRTNSQWDLDVHAVALRTSLYPRALCHSELPVRSETPNSRPQVDPNHPIGLADAKESEQQGQMTTIHRLLHTWETDEQNHLPDDISFDFEVPLQPNFAFRPKDPPMLSPRKRYLYTPLDGIREEIRLLELVPGRAEQPIEVRLQRVSLQSAPRYTALSYCWGDPSDPIPIYIDAGRLDISQNLWHCLYHLRDENQPLTLWVDALCIDQQNFEERNNQVLLMASIYSMAETVIAWLGPETQSSQRGIDCLNNNASLISKEYNSTSHNMAHNLFAKGIMKVLAEDLLARSYWTRVWIFQEILSAKELKILCGTSTIDFNILAAAVKIYSRSLVTSTLASSGNTLGRKAIHTRLEQLLDLDGMRKSYQTKKLDIFSLLAKYGDQRTTDPRDKVFALLGLATDDSSGTLLPDYAKSWEEVYIETARHIIKRNRTLTILSMAGAFSERSTELPSWVPDWRSKQSSNSLFQSGMPRSFGIRFSAAGQSRVSVSFSADSKCLEVDGLSVDEIMTVTSPLVLDSANAFSSFITTAMKQALYWGDDFYRNGEDIRASVYKTLCADIDWRGERCSMGETFWEIFSPGYSTVPADYRPEDSESRRLDMLRREMLSVVLAVNHERSFITTENRFIGLVPASARPGDEVCIFFGSEVPFVLRRFGDNYILIGECYVHGIMDGEAMRKLENETIAARKFSIV